MNIQLCSKFIFPFLWLLFFTKCADLLYQKEQEPDYFIELWGESYSIQNTIKLKLSNNNLDGHIPLEIGLLSNLVCLDLSNNQLSGKVPSEIIQLKKINYLNLSNNNFSGGVTDSLCNFFAEIDTFYFDEVVSLWGFCYMVNDSPEYIDLSHRGLEGSIPPEIGKLTNLCSLSLHNNQISGEIPPEIGNLINLNYLSLYNNQISGRIPPEIGNLINLNKLYLFNNQLSGEIPSSIGDLYQLNKLRLDNNYLEGIIPESLCQLTPYTDTLAIPDFGTGECCYYYDIRNITLNDNKLCRPYPSCFNFYVTIIASGTEHFLGSQNCER